MPPASVRQVCTVMSRANRHPVLGEHLRRASASAVQSCPQTVLLVGWVAPGKASWMARSNFVGPLASLVAETRHRVDGLVMWGDASWALGLCRSRGAVCYESSRGEPHERSRRAIVVRAREDSRISLMAASRGRVTASPARRFGERAAS